MLASNQKSHRLQKAISREQYSVTIFKFTLGRKPEHCTFSKPFQKQSISFTISFRKGYVRRGYALMI